MAHSLCRVKANLLIPITVPQLGDTVIQCGTHFHTEMTVLSALLMHLAACDFEWQGTFYHLFLTPDLL